MMLYELVLKSAPKTYSFENGANLKSPEGFHKLVRSWVAHAVLKGQNATFLHG